ncbi:hypothetical protein SDC9_119475 [bioreactor metagenome]|uniref:Uncharacterized protein n=1 Tax=bioreactor metagenome TaxID=1076179 RepID=A0A645C4D9_9ZZZZ
MKCPITSAKIAVEIAYVDIKSPISWDVVFRGSTISGNTGARREPPAIAKYVVVQSIRR